MKHFDLACPRCGRSNPVDLTEHLTGLRCRYCSGFLDGAQLREEPSPEHAPERRKIRKFAGDRGDPGKWKDQTEAVEGRRVRWPRWFKFLFAGAFAVLLPLLAILIRLQMPKDHENLAGETETPLPPYPAPTVPADPRTMEWMIGAREVARKVCTAETVDEMLPFLLHDGVPVERLRKFYADGEAQLPLGSLTDGVMMPDDAVGELLVLFEYMDSRSRRRFVIMADRGDGPRVDWPSLVGLSDMPLARFKESRTAEPVTLRLRARRVDYYNFAFSDPARWLCLELTDYDDTTTVFGYLERNTPAAVMMERYIPYGEGAGAALPPKPFQGKLAFPAGSTNPEQVKIVEVLALSWYTSPRSQVWEQAKKDSADILGAAPKPSVNQ